MALRRCRWCAQVTYPLDTLRLRLAVDPAARSLRGAALALLREGSYAAFFRGLGASMLGNLSCAFESDCSMVLLCACRSTLWSCTSGLRLNISAVHSHRAAQPCVAVVGASFLVMP